MTGIERILAACDAAVPLCHPARVDVLTVFEARCEARAYLVEVGKLDKIEAVDGLQSAAEADGLVQRLGQDAVQAIMARHFASAS